jgi:hypothetical protein
MRVRQLERLIKILSPRTAGNLDFRMRSFRTAGLLPMGGRGTSAPHIEAEHAALIILGCADARNYKDAAKTALRLAKLQNWDGEPFDGSITLGEALTKAISNVSSAEMITRIELVLPSGRFANRDDSWATIYWQLGAASYRSIYISRVGMKFMHSPDDLGAAFMLDVAFLGRGFLREIAIAVNRHAN